MTLVGVHAGLSVDHLVTEPVGARFSCLGGPGVYAALGARLVAGTTVRVSGPLPDDEPRFAELFAALGVDATHASSAPTVPRLWMLTSGFGRRIVRQAPAGTELADDAGEPDELPAPGRAFLAGLDGLLASAPTTRPPVAADTVVGVDPHQLLVARDGEAYLRGLLTTRSVLLPSRVQLALLDTDPRRAARNLLDRLGVPVVARLDAEGSYVVTRDGAWSVVDGEVAVVESTGAGDVSAGAIVAAVAAGAEVVEAAAYGTSAARIVLSGWGHEALVDAPPMSRPFPGISTRKET